MSFTVSLLTFVAAAAAIAFFGSKLAGIADELADATGVGEAMAGAVLLGGTTSIAGIVVSVTAAWEGRPEMAVSNAIGGIAVQTFFLAIADISYRDANLEHAAASSENMLQAALLLVLLCVPMIAASAPQVAFWGIHPATPVMLTAYSYGLRLISSSRQEPMWRATRTAETREDVPDPQQSASLLNLSLKFGLFGTLTGVAGYFLMYAAIALARVVGVSDTFAGEIFTGITTSLPELVTSVAAVRRGALALAVGGIIGGNAFDTLFLAMADVAYRPGSIYGAMTDQHVLSITVTLLMTSLLLGGLLRREKHGVGNIGFESFGVALAYISLLAIRLWTEL